MADNLSTFYNAGYGKAIPQVGTGVAQVTGMPDVPDFAKSVSEGVARKDLKASQSAAKKSAADKAKAKALGDYKFYNAEPLNKAANSYYNDVFTKEVEALDVDDLNFNTRLSEIVNKAESTFSTYGKADEAFLTNRKLYAAGGYEQNPLFEDDLNGVNNFEIDPKNPESYAALGQTFGRMSTLLKKPERINVDTRANEVVGGISKDVLLSNPDFFNNYEDIKDLGGNQQLIWQKAELNPKGRAALKDILRNDPKLISELDLKYSEMDNPDGSKKEYMEREIARMAAMHGKKYTSSTRSKGKGTDNDKSESGYEYEYTTEITPGRKALLAKRLNEYFKKLGNAVGEFKDDFFNLETVNVANRKGLNKEVNIGGDKGVIRNISKIKLNKDVANRMGVDEDRYTITLDVATPEYVGTSDGKTGRRTTREQKELVLGKSDLFALEKAGLNVSEIFKDTDKNNKNSNKKDGKEMPDEEKALELINKYKPQS